jgi:hypothetical protein
VPPLATSGVSARSRRAFRVVLLLLGAGFAAVGAGGQQPPIFEDVSREAGIDFVHFNGMAGDWTIAEITGAGAALFDFDGDGDLDAYLVQGAMLGGDMSRALFPWRGAEPPRGRLLRNDLEVGPDGTRRPRFVDVTGRSGIDAGGYGMGAATGDFDNDGRVDLYLTNLGPNRLYRNRGDGTFADVTGPSGTDDPRWSTGAAFLDYDRDGDLDLYVANYVDFESDPTRACYAGSSARDFCGPKAYRPVPDRLFRNRGDGTFDDVTASSGVASAWGAGFGVVAADLDGDDWLDIYVANDGDPNLLWINQRDGTFRNDALFAGAALDANGAAQASMGLDAGDFDGDGDEDLVMTHIVQESNALYVNDGRGLFEDRSIPSGIAAVSRSKTGFGVGWIDYDNDGWLDLLVLNGAVLSIPDLARQGDPYPLGMANDLLRNRGDGTFAVESERGGEAFARAEVGRGAAFGDVDNDGDADVLVTNNNGPARLLLNRAGNIRPWIGLRLLTAGGRDALGARVEVIRRDGPSLWRRAGTDGSYCSARDPRVLVGLGSAADVTAVRVRWPSGRIETFGPPPRGRYVDLREGTGTEAP